jgi:hypothetical protein
MIGRTAVYIHTQTSAANGHWSSEPWEELARTVERLAIEAAAFLG